jgi:hypothetical protein
MKRTAPPPSCLTLIATLHCRLTQLLDTETILSDVTRGGILGIRAAPTELVRSAAEVSTAMACDIIAKWAVALHDASEGSAP